jgi:Fe-S oxidoreductase
MARLKAEWQQQRHDCLGVPLRTRMLAAFGPMMRAANRVRPLANALLAAPASAGVVRRLLGLAPRRSLPLIDGPSLRSWHRRHGNPPGLPYPHGPVHLFCDEFTDTTDTRIGIAAITLLNRLGWRVEIPRHVDSGRAAISLGLLRDARRLADRNVALLTRALAGDTPVVGLEPSAVLGFRDEYPDLVSAALRLRARALAPRVLLLEEFLAREAKVGRIAAAQFDTAPRHLLVHGHCHQKALASMDATLEMLSLPSGHSVEAIPSGCCGMAGSFGYDRAHFELSMQIGELVLFPAVRGAPTDSQIVASGTSCRHQILDGTGRRAVHPVEVMREALLPE